MASQEIGGIIFPWDGKSWGPLNNCLSHCKLQVLIGNVLQLIRTQINRINKAINKLIHCQIYNDAREPIAGLAKQSTHPAHTSRLLMQPGLRACTCVARGVGADFYTPTHPVGGWASDVPISRGVRKGWGGDRGGGGGGEGGGGGKKCKKTDAETY